jgi:hypothetical protein
LYAGDAAEAFDTILHQGEMGQIYNVDSRDEISNIQLAEKLLGIFGLKDKQAWIQHTHDRKFNDRRYAVDGSKLRKLGWEQRTSFDDALASTVEWYEKCEGWFGEIESVLTAHPVVVGDHVVAADTMDQTMKDPEESETGVGAAHTALYDVGRDPKLAGSNGVCNGKNGHKHVGAKKRKADSMTQE